MCSKRRWSSEWSSRRILPYSEVMDGNCSTSPREVIQLSRMRGSPFFRSISMFGSLNGPLVSYTYTGALGVITFLPSTTVTVGVRFTFCMPTFTKGKRVPCM